MKRWSKLIRGLSLLTQLGLSIAAPPVLLVFLALALQRRFGWGGWAVPAALAVGLISSACGAVRLYRSVMKHTEDGEPPPRSFNGHT